MFEYLGKQWEKEDFLKYIGDPRQIAGAIPSILSDGKANGVNNIQVYTGSGLEFNVLPGRGMDIPFARYKGKSLTFHSHTGITHPRYYEEPDFEWLRSFYVGLLTTCGISQSGMPNVDNGKSLGLHGRIANTEAESVVIKQDWVDGEYVIEISGIMREVSAMWENLSLKRTITTKLGSSEIIIRDTVTNHNYIPTPVMILYHLNFGFPLLSENAEIIMPTKVITPRDEESIKDNGVEEALSFSKPVNNYHEKAFFHELGSEENGDTVAAVVNSDIGDGSPLGVIVHVNKKQLPKFFEWKIVREGFYACGLEPGMVHPIGRAATRKEGDLIYLEGQQSYDIDIKLSIIDTKKEVDDLRKYVEVLKNK